MITYTLNERNNVNTFTKMSGRGHDPRVPPLEKLSHRKKHKNRAGSLFPNTTAPNSKPKMYVATIWCACLGTIQVLRNAFPSKLNPHPPPLNANNVDPYTFVTLFTGQVDTPHRHLRYVTLESNQIKSNQVYFNTTFLKNMTPGCLQDNTEAINNTVCNLDILVFVRRQNNNTNNNNIISTG